MIITEKFQFKDGSYSIDGESLWGERLCIHVGDILECGAKRWKVIDVSHIFQGCFGTPKYRHHSLKLEPIDHSDMPETGDELVKQDVSNKS